MGLGNRWNCGLARLLRRRRHDRLCSPRLLAALVKPERRILIGHQARVPSNSQRPTVHAEHEVIHGLRIATREKQDDGREDDQ